MGNYLVACAVSGLNIHPDEGIVVVPLFRQEYPLVNGLHEGIRVDDTEVYLPARKCGRRPTDIYHSSRREGSFLQVGGGSRGS